MNIINMKTKNSEKMRWEEKSGEKFWWSVKKSYLCTRN